MVGALAGDSVRPGSPGTRPRPPDSVPRPRDPDDNSRAASGILGRMPELSRFFGVVIKMYHSEHGPPHFHAIHAEHEITVEVESGIVQGSFPSQALRRVIEWAELHRWELLANWERARQHKRLERIPPLE